MRGCRSFVCLMIAAIHSTLFAAETTQMEVNGRIIQFDPKYLSPTAEERALAAPVQAELDQWYQRAKATGASATLKEIRRYDKEAEDALTPQDRQKALEKLDQVKASTDPEYLAYLEADKALTEALSRVLASMSQRDRLLNPLMNSYARVIPYIDSRENTIPKSLGELDNYRATYERDRSAAPSGTEAFLQWQGGLDPTFDEFNRFLASLEQAEGFIPGFLHSIAWRESEPTGSPKTGAANADERGMFQIQSTDYQPEFGVPLGEPAGSLWTQFPSYCKWIPYNAAIAAHAYKRLVDQAREYGFTGDDCFQLAYRFYNESSGYILFCQQRLKIYRELFGLTPQDLHENNIQTLDRFIYFTQEQLLQMYDWQMPDGRLAGEALWEAWKNAKVEVTSDLMWKVLQRRLLEGKQYFVLQTDESGRRWCVADLTEQNIKRRGQVGISGLNMTAIGICSARGVVPTAQIFREYFYGAMSPEMLQPIPTPIPAQPPAPTPPPTLVANLPLKAGPWLTSVAPAAAPEGMAAAPTPPAVTPMPEMTPMPAANPTPVFDTPWQEKATPAVTPLFTPLPALPVEGMQSQLSAEPAAAPLAATPIAETNQPNGSTLGSLTPTPDQPSATPAPSTATPVFAQAPQSTPMPRFTPAPSVSVAPLQTVQRGGVAPATQPATPAAVYVPRAIAPPTDAPVEAKPVGPMVQK